jgi:hybrid cluster-associated redox disulfide protein
MAEQLITLDLFMDEILDQWPITILLFLEYRMACVGCSMSSFDTLRDALEVYDLPQEIVLDSLNLKAQEAISLNEKTS